MKVTAKTQTRFEHLYYDLAERYTDYALSCMIAGLIDKTFMAVYMYLRQCFTGGSESYKCTLIVAMEIIAQLYLPKEEEAA